MWPSVVFMALSTLPLYRRAGSDLLGHLAGQELAVFEVALKSAPFDDDLAAQYDERGPGGEVAALPRGVVGLVQFGGADDLTLSRVEQHDVGVRAHRQRAFARVEAHDLGGVGRDQ